MAYDGISALNKVGISKEYIKCNSTDVHLISITSALWRSSNFSALKAHVRGHKDSDEFFGPLTLMETMNWRMDALAKNIALSGIAGDSQPHTSPVTLAIGTITYAGNIITSHVQQSLYESILH